MCGIVGIIKRKFDSEGHINGVNSINNVFTELYEGLFHLQHRGQDSVGIELFENNQKCHIIKKMGLIHNLKAEFHNFINIYPHYGLGHIRYSTNNGINDRGEEYDKLTQIQPIYKKHHTSSYNIHLCHNGHMIIDDELIEFCKKHNISTIYNSDSELLYNIFHYFLNLPEIPNLYDCSPDMIMLYLNLIINLLCYYCKGSYSIICVIENIGLICFKDNRGIRPLSYGFKDEVLMIASESIALSSQNYDTIQELNNTDILLCKFNGHLEIYKKDVSKILQQNNQLRNRFSFLLNISYNLSPCIFEWIYLARAESIIYDIPVYTARLHMGHLLANKIKNKVIDIHEYDYVIPIPDTSRPYALSISNTLGIPYIEAIIKNRYIYRTFIMDTQEKRQHNLKRKLNVIPSLIKNKNIIIVDDSIVRGNTMNHIISLLKQTQVGKITVVSAAPQIINKNTYGLDIPTKGELISSHYNPIQLAQKYGVEHVIFQDIDNLYKTINMYNTNINNLELSIFQ